MFYLITGGIFIIDLFTKYIASNYLQGKTQLLGDFFYLQLIHNSGIAFGISIPSLILKVSTLFLILGLFYYYKKERISLGLPKKIDVAFGMIIGGALANAYERIFYNQVVDFIGIQYFAIFNIADVVISLGALLYIATLYPIKKCK